MKWFDAGTKKKSASTFWSFIELMKLPYTASEHHGSYAGQNPALRGLQSADTQGTSGGAGPGRALARNPLPAAAIAGQEEEQQELNQRWDVGSEHAEG